MDLDQGRHERGPIHVFKLPHNGRDEIYDEGEGPSFCERESDEERLFLKATVVRVIPTFRQRLRITSEC
jgi:hypothetical protein